MSIRISLTNDEAQAAMDAINLVLAGEIDTDVFEDADDWSVRESLERVRSKLGR